MEEFKSDMWFDGCVKTYFEDTKHILRIYTYLRIQTFFIVLFPFNYILRSLAVYITSISVLKNVRALSIFIIEIYLSWWF